VAARARSVSDAPQTGLTMTSNLLKATIELLDMTALEDWKRLATECDLTVAWIRQLVAGDIKEPGINKVERLYTALSGKTVDL
jgi:hypothetical protein